jgi:hypothetical protein
LDAFPCFLQIPIDLLCWCVGSHSNGRNFMPPSRQPPPFWRGLDAEG